MKAEHQKELLKILDKCFKAEDGVSSASLSSQLGWEHDYMVGLLKSLEVAGMITCTAEAQTSYQLTAEGEEVLAAGSPEWLLMQLLPLSVEAIKANPVHQRALAYCLKNKWATKTDAMITVVTLPENDATQQQLKSVVAGADDDVAALIKRKLVTKVTRTIFRPQPTAAFGLELRSQLVDLTRELLQSGEWAQGSFKGYNFNACGIPPAHGSVHPLMKTRAIYRQILQQMGFEEMDSRRWVENSFWNFDALFQPQTHPVRDAHDTFFVKDLVSATVAEQEGGASAPLSRISEAANLLDTAYFERVKKMHESGGGASLGWQYKWEEAEAYKLILRPHTTAVTSRVLRHLALESAGKPSWPFGERRFFSIDRVFRNETLDATHLAEFHQVEGIVCSENASLASLMGIIKTFFARIGIEDIKFKPAYNPYTEPSMEIFGYHPTLKKWTEIGNSGIFRPEMLEPMGLPPNLVVLGWGLSLERPTMITHNVKDIRELFGPKAKLNVF